jgi:N6-adenosine-specific RNA methylase IME4
MSKIYSTIMADPPWYQRGGGKSKRGADRHYDILKEHEIKAVMSKMLQGKVAENAHMYMWVANNHLAEGLRILEHLEFRYITKLVWAMPSFGVGRYFRGQHEICLFATRGRGFSVRSEANNVSTLIGGSMIKPTKHSAKPQEIYDLVESRSKGSYLELFARNSRPGWDCLGNEAPSEENE